MVGETEHRTWRIAQGGLASYDALTSAPTIMTAAVDGQPSRLQVPKHSTIQLKKMRGSIALDEDILTANNKMKINLGAVNVDAPSPVLTTGQLRTLWTYVASRKIAGTPANAESLREGITFEIDFKDRHIWTRIHNQHTGAKTASRTGNMGWVFVMQASGANMNFLADFEVDYDIIWDERTGRSRLDPTEDENWEYVDDNN